MSERAAFLTQLRRNAVVAGLMSIAGRALQVVRPQS
jgi:hypothetical protein